MLEPINGKRILLIITGGVAAFKTLTLIRELKRAGAEVTPVLTRAAEEFVTPLSVSALAGVEVRRELFDLTQEAEMGHIELSRGADLIVVAPATAHLMARAAHGICDDLAATLLLASDTRVLMAPAMNVRMWEHPATQRNIAQLRKDGVHMVGPAHGQMACGEVGAGRMSEVDEIMRAIAEEFASGVPLKLGETDRPPLRLGPEQQITAKPLIGRRILITSGPTHEPIDPVRYIANRSSGRQGTEIAAALRDLGANIVFITGPAEVPAPEGVEVVKVQAAAEMKAAVAAALPVDAAVMAAAVADWRVENAGASKIKKAPGSGPPTLIMAENPDILAWLSQHETARPALVVGFAAETDDVINHARAKLARKGCDWILANDVRPETGIMGGLENRVTLVSADGQEEWPRLGKAEVARRLAERISDALAES